MTPKPNIKTTIPCYKNTLNIIPWNVRVIMSSATSLSQTLGVLDIDIALLTEYNL